MKYSLLGTSALVAAAGLVIGQANAADGVKLGLGGFYSGAYGSHFDTQNDDSTVEGGRLDRADVLKQNAEVHFKGEAVLDNGLTVGARVELEAQQDVDQTDQVFAYLSGGFGEFRIGNTGEALGQECAVAPSATQMNAGGMFGADSPGFAFNNIGASGGYGATNGTCYGISGDATKLVYFSPSFGGFNFTASYAPNGDEDENNGGAGPRAGGFGTTSDGDTPFQDSEIYSVAANFAQDFNGVSVGVGGGVSWSFDLEGDGFALDESDLDKREEYNAHAIVGFGLGDGTLTVGGAYSLRANVRDGTVTATIAGATHVTAVNDDNDDEIWSAGVVYGIDAWAIGASVSFGSYESACPGDSCADDHETYMIDAGYALGPSVGIGAMVAYDEYDPGDGATPGEEYEAITAGMGLYIGF